LGFRWRRAALGVIVAAWVCLTGVSAPAVDIVVDDWGNLSTEERAVTQHAIDEWEALLPETSHQVHLTFDNANLGAIPPPNSGQKVEDAKGWIPKADGGQELTTLGRSFNFTEDADGRPISSDIEMNNNAVITWHVGLDAPPGGQVDYYSVMTHEICHALGFTVYYERFERNVTPKAGGGRTYNDGGTPTATLVSSGAGTHLSSFSHPNHLMNTSINAGVRRSPSALEVDMLAHDVWDYPPPDLTYENPNHSVAGTTVGVSVRVRNAAGAGTADASVLGYYLSPNSTISTADYLIGTDAVPALGSGGFSSENINVDVRSIYPPIPSGTYYVGIFVDHGTVVAESSEGNNTYSFASPQVTITTMSAPGNVQATDGAYSDRIRLTWNAVSGATHYRVYRHTVNSAVDATALTGWLAGTTYYDYDPGPGGQYYYWVKAAASVFGSGESGFSVGNAGHVVPTSLNSDVEVDTADEPAYYRFRGPVANSSNWWVVAVRNNVAGGNWSMRLYEDETFATELASSTYTKPVDFVVGDGNHFPVEYRGVRAYRYSGSGDASVEYEGHTETLSVGTNAGIAWVAGDVAEMWDVALTPGSYNIELRLNSGTADLDIGLFGSGRGVYVKNRESYLARSTAGGAAENESFTATVDLNDEYGLCVWANDESAANFDIVIDPLQAGLWEGDVSTDWHTAGNWNDNRVPSATVNVVIPPGTPHSPVIENATAYCRDMTIERGATLTLENQELHINDDLVCHGSFAMNRTLTHTYIADDVSWEAGSTLRQIGSARIHVGGNWFFQEGANIQPSSGYVQFDGSGTSLIRSYESGCGLFRVVCNKSGGGSVYVSRYSVDALRLDNVYIWQGRFESNSPYPVVIEGFLNNMGGNIACHDGSLEFAGNPGSVELKPNVGDFLNDLIIRSTAPITLGTNYTDTLVVNGDVIIQSGALAANGMDIDVGGSWSNGVGNAGFVEGTDRVTFVGAADADILTDESFHYLTVEKTSTSPEALELAAGKTARVGWWLEVRDGMLKMNSGSALDVRYDVRIDEGAGLNADAAGVNIYVEDDWMNENSGYSPTNGFTPGTSSRIIFDGTGNQHVRTGAAQEEFFDVLVDKSFGSVACEDGVLVKGDCVVSNGSWSFYQDHSNLTHYFEGDLTIGAGGSWDDQSAGSTVYFQGTRLKQTLTHVPAAGGFVNLVVNKPWSGRPRVPLPVQLGSDVHLAGEALVDSGILDVRGHTLECLGDLTVDEGGILRANNGSTVEIGVGQRLYVGPDGAVEFLGSVGSNSRLTRSGRSGFFDVYLDKNAQIGAEHTVFEYVSARGVYVTSLARIDPKYPFTRCTFGYGESGGCLLRVDNAERHRIVSARFPTTTPGRSYNVLKTVDQGELVFVNATGMFGGEMFDGDTHNRIHWRMGALAGVTISGPTFVTKGGSYLYRATVTGDDVITPITYRCTATDLAPCQHTHSAMQDMLDMGWDSGGQKVIQVTASNEVGTVTDARVISVGILSIDSIAARVPDGMNQANRLTLSGTSGDSDYAIEYCTNLIEGFWMPAPGGANVPGVDGTMNWSHIINPASQPGDPPTIYYRAILQEGGDW